MLISVLVSPFQFSKGNMLSHPSWHRDLLCLSPLCRHYVCIVVDHWKKPTIYFSFTVMHLVSSLVRFLLWNILHSDHSKKKKILQSGNPMEMSWMANCENVLLMHGGKLNLQRQAYINLLVYV